MYLIVGLGNPGKEYENTYHNIGFMAADKLAKFFGVDFDRKVCDSSVLRTCYNGVDLVIAKPLGYMNNSGFNVARLVKKYNVKPENIIVLVDDIDIDKGTIRYREHGSAGTHNGLRNIVACLGSTEFKRVRIGIGPYEGALIDYVLSRIDRVSMDKITPALDMAVDKVLEIIK